MTPPHLIETFNTHRMKPEVVRLLATGRDAEVHELLTEIRYAATHPGTPLQHLIVYGERGSGKSFLLRLVEIEVENLVSEEQLPIACVLLPEEQYNIKSAAQLLEAVAAKIRGADWGETAYSFDFRPVAQAWEAAVKSLHETLDQRFGAGRGLAVAMIENFDAVAKTLFGAETLTRGKTKSAATEAAIERRAAEERLRRFIGRKDARFMLVASATGTVDLDYERPLFLAFKPIDLTVWDGDTCIAYFNKRRQLDGAPKLTAVETARARAIAEFIGGNPRSAQLLAEVLNSPDARTIAQTLDALSDHLADYYRRRLDDLPVNTAGLLDALIRTGEPCSQSELAERVGAQQSQIADAFSYLVLARLLSAVRERNGHGTFYRVRDRLFVHFYRRRYGGEEQSAGLGPIVELLAGVCSATERDELARRHLEAGEFAEARIFRGLGGTLASDRRGYLAAQVGNVHAQAVCLRNKAWSLGRLSQHQDAIAICDEAAALAAQVGDVREQAKCLCNKAWHLGQIEHLEEALTICDQAAALAKEAQDLDELSQVLRLKSALLLDNGQLPAALETIRAALAVYDQGVSPKERQWRLEQFFAIAERTPAPDVITRFAQVLTETTTDDRWFDIYLDDVMAAVTRAEVWAELRDLVQKHEAWFAKAGQFPIFNEIGTVWADFVTTRGRAATFALVARDLRVIAEAMTRMPDRAHLRDLVAGIVSTCADAGFLRDVAGLIVEVFGPDAEDEATRLRAFAKFHAAEDKEKVLQRFDPDLAKAIRRMWNLPEPEDLLARRGRPKGR